MLKNIIINNGIKKEYSNELKGSIKIANATIMLSIIFVLPFLIYFTHSLILFSLELIPLVLFIFSFMLIKFNKQKIGRFLFSITTTISIFFLSALFHIDDADHGFTAKFLILASIIIPFIIFTTREVKFIVIIVIIDVIFLFSFDYINSIITITDLKTNYNNEIIRNISILTTLFAIVGAFVLFKTNQKQQIDKLKIAAKKLLKAKKQLINVHETAKLGSWSLNLKTFEITLSREHQKMIGQKTTKITMPLMQYAKEFIVEADVAIIEQRLKHAVENIDNLQYEDKFNYRVNLASNEILHLAVIGQIMPGGIIFGVTQDVTKQREYEVILEKHRNKLEDKLHKKNIALESSRDIFKNIFNSSTDAIFITDLEGIFLEFNNVTLNRVGVEAEQMSELNMVKFHRPENQDIIDYFNKIKQEGVDTIIFAYKNINNKKYDVELKGKLINHNNKDAILHISRDISQRIEDEKEKMNIIMQTEERERKRFSKDIHDTLGATLSASKMYINIAKRSKGDHEKIDKMLDEAINLISNASKNAKEIAVNIIPHELSNFGLKTALHNFCNKINELGNISIIFETDNFDIRFSDYIEIQIYRIINELINNTLKHAKANTITLKLLYDNNKIIIYFNDNGVGFDYERVMKSDKIGTGLENIIYRVNSIGGKIKITSNELRGMTAIIEIEKSEEKEIDSTNSDFQNFKT